MRTLYDPIRKSVAEVLEPALKSMGGTNSLQEIFEALVEPPNPEMGDLAFGCFSLAKTLKKGPPMIAKELAGLIKNPGFIAKAEAAGPYLNFHLKPEFFGEKLLAPVLSGSFFKSKLTEKTPRTMIEFCQPNTHKELHVGHMRNACLGDALVKTLRYSGYDIISATFPGDVGTHVAKCLWYLKYRNQEKVPATHKGEWLGQMYSKGSILLDDEKGTPAEEKNRQQLTEILRQLEAKKGEFYDLWKETKQWSVDLMNEAYGWAEISFDQWYWESDVDSTSVAYVKRLQQEGKLVVSEGAIGMDLSADNLGFCLLLKSDGTGLYATKDLELARRKFQENHIEKSVYVVDMRQALHFQQVFKVLEKLGFPEAKQCYHLQYNYVELPDGAMSSRKGNIVPLMRLVHSMEKMVRDTYLQKYVGDWPTQEIEQVAREVAQGAIKYGMVKIDSNKKIVFDLQEWLKIDGDSGPFIQYSAARIQSIERKIGKVPESPQWQLLVHPTEKHLMQQLLHFHHVVLQASETLRPSVICTYLYELAKKYNHFYHECSIGQAETEDLKGARLALSRAVGEVLRHGLSLLGIPTPQRM